MNLPFTIKYAPNSLKEVLGQDVSKILRHAELNPKAKACLINGPAGTGKTSVIHALAQEKGFELIEVNSASIRDGESIAGIVGTASLTSGLFGKRIILVDDVDSMSGSDRGGISELVSCVKNTRTPIFITCLDVWDQKLKSLRSCCDIVDFKKVRASLIKDLLKNICVKENIKVSDGVLYKIASHADGDVRAAINDLEMLSVSNDEVTDYDLEAMGFRERPVSIFDGLQVMFKSLKASEAATALDDVDMDFNTKFLWVGENIPNEFSSKLELSKAFNALSRADVFNGRIRKREYWRFLVYVNALMTAGVNGAREGVGGFVKYKNPSRILKLWQSKSGRELRNDISVKLQPGINASLRKIKSGVIPFLKFIIKDASVVSRYALNSEELEFIRK